MGLFGVKFLNNGYDVGDADVDTVEYIICEGEVHREMILSFTKILQ